MNFEEIVAIIKQTIASDNVIVNIKSDAIQPFIELDANYLLPVCQLLFTHENLYFDYLTLVTGIDNGPEKDTMEVIYHLYSIPYEHSFIIKVTIPRHTNEPEKLPTIDSITPIWGGANWHEREAFDLLGIRFTSHPDLRRILMPNDWVGYPLRKDYQVQETYHGIKVAY